MLKMASGFPVSSTSDGRGTSVKSDERENWREATKKKQQTNETGNHGFWMRISWIAWNRNEFGLEQNI